MEDLSGMGEFAAEAIKHGTVSFISWFPAGRLLIANPRFFGMTGYSAEESSAMRWPHDFTSEELGECIARGMKKPDAEERSCQCEGNIVRKDRSQIPVSVFLHMYHPGHGREPLYYAFITDISRLKEQDKRLQLTQFAIDHFMDSSLWLDTDGRIVYANEAACNALGYTREELLSMRIWDIDSAYAQDRYASLLDYISNVRHMELESCGIARDGRRFPVEVHASLIQYMEAELVICFVRDITDRKLAEEALKESEEKFRVLSELSPSAIFLYQGDKLIYANPAAVGFTGFSTGELLSKNFWDMIHPDYRDLVKTYGLARQKGEPVPARYDVKYTTKSGEERWAEFSAGMIEYKGRPAGIVTAIDTTDRKLSEIALWEAKAQAELYVDLMGHDINNMNQAALGFLEMATDKIQSVGGLEAGDLPLIASAMESLRNSSKLIGSVRKLQKEKKGVLQSQVMSLGPVLTAVKEQYTKVPGRDVTISYNALCECGVQANELLVDLFSNIVGNAIKHSTGPLAININLQVEEEQERRYCKVTIEDNGPGISDEQKRKIFERAGKDHARLTGKGLGLYLVKTLVDDYRGRVWVEDHVTGDHTNGSRFVVLLPAVTGQPEDVAEEVNNCGS